MKKRILLPMCAVFAFLLVACAKPEVTTNRSDSTSTATSTSTPATMAPSSGEKIGVPECDDFIAAYDACVSSKVPEAARAQYKASLEQWRTSWRRLAENPQTKPTLVQACKQSAEQARTQLRDFNCTL